MRVQRLDSRAWLSWGAAVTTPVLLGRNPWMLAQVLLIVVIVRAVWAPVMERRLGWFIRLAGSLAVIGITFNVLTVHAGDLVFGALPGSWPVIGGPLTWNALVYGVLSGIALFTLVLAGLTVSSLISWIDLFHALPRRLAPIAVTGSVAWAFLPQTAVAWRQIRETQVMRGHTFRGARDFIPIVVPLLASGLDRSLVTAVALEARGFGGSPPITPTRRGQLRETAAAAALVAGLVGLAVSVYCLAVGMVAWALFLAATGAGSLGIAFASRPDPRPRITRYRATPWTGADSGVTITALGVLAGVIRWNGVSPDTWSYAPYPTLATPAADPAPLLLLGLLLAPAAVYQPQRDAA